MSKRLTPMVWFVILCVIAVGLALGLPPDPQAVRDFHTTSLMYRIAIAAVLVPYIAIWYAAFYAFAKLQEYSKLLTGAAQDGAAFRKITIGMGAIAFSLIIPTILSLILGNIASHNAGFKPASQLISSYAGLLPGALAFLLLHNGTRALVRTTEGWCSKLDIRWHAPWFLLLCATYTYLVINNQQAGHPYHLDLPLLIATFIVPFLYGWTLGLLSAYDLRLYARHVKGTLYKQAIKRFSTGIAVTIFGSIAVQFTATTILQRFEDSIGAVIILYYLLLGIVATGLILIALGTKKLRRLEEV